VFSLIASIKRTIDTHGKPPECGESREPLGSVLVLIVQAAPAVIATSRKLDLLGGWVPSFGGVIAPVWTSFSAETRIA